MGTLLPGGWFYEQDLIAVEVVMSSGGLVGTINTCVNHNCYMHGGMGKGEKSSI